MRVRVKNGREGFAAMSNNGGDVARRRIKRQKRSSLANLYQTESLCSTIHDRQQPEKIQENLARYSTDLGTVGTTTFSKGPQGPSRDTIRITISSDTAPRRSKPVS